MAPTLVDNFSSSVISTLVENSKTQSNVNTSENNDNSTQNSVISQLNNKPEEQFRNYVDGKFQSRVRGYYRENHRNQTYEAVRKLEDEVLQLRKATMSIWESIDLLDSIVDQSDPDTALPQTYHMFQTAEAIRKAWPQEEYDWFALTGLVHDLGKIIAHKNFYNLPQWAVVGDTFPVGCRFSEKNVFPDLFAENEDFNNPNYNTKYGIYSPNCGLKNVHMSFGHDEYMYHVCVKNGVKLPMAGLYIIRYHSFYAWHNKGGYEYLMDDQDRELLPWVKEFQKHDLYSKDDGNLLPLDEMKAYYSRLIEKYFPPVLNW
jgi:inositol oxygenase